MDNVKELYAANKPQGGGNGLFLKLEDGDNVRMRILDVPVVYDTTFEDPKTHIKKTSVKYAWLVYNHDEEKVQILQGGATIYNSLNDLIQDDDWGDPKNYDIKVSRTGKGMNDTKYSVSPSPKSKDLPAEMETVDVVAMTNSSDFNSNVHKLGESPVHKEVVLEDIDENAPLDLGSIPF